MSERTPNLLIEDLLEAARKIQKFTDGLSFEQFLLDDKTIDAVIRNFEIIGEASHRLPEEFKSSHSSIDWIRMRGFRNRIVHDYFGIDHSIVWNISQTYLQALIDELEVLLRDMNK